MSSPAQPPDRKLKLTSQDETMETSFAGRKSILIGRGTSCDVVIKDAKASREHCRLSAEEKGFILVDLGSRNGTFVEGTKITGPTKLQINQTFKVGDTVFYLA